MKKTAVHFGAGNIGRGFIGETLFESGYKIVFIDANQTLIDQINNKKTYPIEYLGNNHQEKWIRDIEGINNLEEPQAVIEKIAISKIVTTSIGPKILPHIAETIAQGIDLRCEKKISEPLIVTACENMVGASTFLADEIEKYIKHVDYFKNLVTFPNSAVDRIVPRQTNESDLLKINVEPYKELIIEKTKFEKRDSLNGALYVEDITPYIERKLYSVNTGHATIAYCGLQLGYHEVSDALNNPLVKEMLEKVLYETSEVLISKWSFDQKEHEEYVMKTIKRFENPAVSDSLTRIARNPISKLGNKERFIGPLYELFASDNDYDGLLEVIAQVFSYDNPEDEESRVLQEKIQCEPLEQVIKEVTGLKEEILIAKIREKIETISSKQNDSSLNTHLVTE